MRSFQFSHFNSSDNLVGGISTVDQGNMSFKRDPEHPERVCQHRAQFFGEFDIDPNNVVVGQIEDKDSVVIVTKDQRGRGAFNGQDSLKGDILLTEEADVFLVHLAADCAVLLLFEPEKGVCGLIHAGWKGLEQRAVVTGINAMCDWFGCNPAKIRVGIAPMQHVSTNPALASNPYWTDFLARIDDQPSYALISAVASQLRQAGLGDDQWENANVDTVSDGRFFSHRRWDVNGQQGLDGRFASLIGRRA